MPVAVCPHCTAELDLDADDLGQLVECPACQKQFTAGPPPAPEPPPPEPPPPADTRVIVCPECREPVTVAVEDLGHSLRCPLCARQFHTNPPLTPADDTPPWRAADVPPGRQREWPYIVRTDTPKALVRDAKTECTAAATGLIIVGAMTVLVGLVRAGSTLWMVGEFDEPGTYLWLGYGLYSVLVGGFWVYAGLQFKEAKQYGLCLVACVTVLIPGVSPCCVLGLIFGIMGLVKLNDSRVKKGFQANRPGYDPDTPA